MWLLNYAEAPASAERENRSGRANGGVCLRLGDHSGAGGGVGVIEEKQQDFLKDESRYDGRRRREQERKRNNVEMRVLPKGKKAALLKG